MTCWKKQSKRKIEKYRKKSVVYPEKTTKYKVPTPKQFDADERIKCGGCDDYFSLSSNELKIHCNLCCKFFHCKIAGKCDGDACKVTLRNGESHQASYCYDCAGLISKNKILCKDCLLDTHLDKNL